MLRPLVSRPSRRSTGHARGAGGAASATALGEREILSKNGIIFERNNKAVWRSRTFISCMRIAARQRHAPGSGSGPLELIDSHVAHLSPGTSRPAGPRFRLHAQAHLECSLQPLPPGRFAKKLG